MNYKDARAMVSVSRLREMLEYEPVSGAITWRQKPNRKIVTGAQAGSRRKDGYVEISLDGVSMLAHRVAWALMHGEWPTELVDHKDRDPSNNRFSNLRQGDKSLNAQNTLHVRSATGYRGVTRLGKKYGARIKRHGAYIYLGTFPTAAEAGAAYLRARDELHTWRPQ